MKQVAASAPGKLLLFGDHAVVYGTPCIVTAVDQRITVTVRKNGTDVFHLDAPDLGLIAYSKTIGDLGKKESPKGVSFIEKCYKRFLARYPQKEGIVVTTKSEFSSKFGFGSSSAVTVAFAKALTTLYEIQLSDKELFNLCYQAVLDVQGVGSGFDIAAAIWGGTLYYVKPASVIRPLELQNLPLVVGYTGIKADTPTLVRMVETAREENTSEIDAIFSQIGSLVERAEAALKQMNWQEVGKCMHEHQILLQNLHVSSVKLDELISASEESGAFGAKLSGAGGGDCMIAIAPEEKKEKIEAAITQAKGEVMHVTLHAPGVRIEETE